MLFQFYGFNEKKIKKNKNNLLNTMNAKYILYSVCHLKTIYRREIERRLCQFIWYSLVVAKPYVLVKKTKNKHKCPECKPGHDNRFPEDYPHVKNSSLHMHLASSLNGVW